MRIYSYGQPGDDIKPKIYEWLKRGVSRFGWSGKDENALVDREGKRTSCWSYAFLLGVEEGDWVVHVNVPTWGQCTAGKVVKRYWFDFDGGIDVSWDSGKDFRHCIGIDTESVVTFDRNNQNVLPNVSNKLKDRFRHHWHGAIKPDEFIRSLDNIKDKKVILEEDETVGLSHLRAQLQLPFEKIAHLIHDNHPKKTLEQFMCIILNNIPSVETVMPNGSGWKSDYGADIIVRYSSGLPISGLEDSRELVVQVKSYIDRIDDKKAIEQIKQAFDMFNPDAGLIVSTAPATESFEKKVEELSEQEGKPIGLLTGAALTRFVLRYGAKELLI